MEALGDEYWSPEEAVDGCAGIEWVETKVMSGDPWVGDLEAWDLQVGGVAGNKLLK